MTPTAAAVAAAGLAMRRSALLSRRRAAAVVAASALPTSTTLRRALLLAAGSPVVSQPLARTWQSREVGFASRSCASPALCEEATGEAPGDRLVVVLDIDECLVHSIGFDDEPVDGYRQLELCRGTAATAKEVDSFHLSMLDGATCTVLKRPGLDAFLQAVASEFEVAAFTAGMQIYAEPLLDQLDPSRTLVSKRFYRDDCRRVHVPGLGTQYVKDLRVLRRDLGRCVLVDNNPFSFLCQPQNGILVPDFTGEADKHLEGVLRLLRELSKLSDVRPRLQELFGLEDRLAPLSARLGGQSRL